MAEEASNQPQSDFSDKILLKVSSAFPFSLFPNSLTIAVGKVDAELRDVFLFDWRHSVFIENITDVTVEVFSFFSTLKITDSTNYRNPVIIEVKHLKHEDALYAEKILQGLRRAKKERTDLTSYHQRESLIEVLEKLGEADDQKDKVEISSKKDWDIPHYYGNYVRMLLVAAGLVMMVGLPYFRDIIPIHYSYSIISLLAIVVMAGMTNPKSMVILIMDCVVSLAGFLIFEFTGIGMFDKGIIFVITNQVLAFIFFLASYFSIRSLRGFIMRIQNQK